MTSGAIKVLLVDDHAVVRAGFQMLLSQSEDIDVIAEAQRGEEACRYYADLNPDVVVMDLSMPGIGGLACIRRIRSRDPGARVLVFSIHDERVYVTRAFEAGARGYITKNSAPDMLTEAVRRIFAGETFLEAGIAERLTAQSFTDGGGALSVSALSAREFDVFCLLAKGYTTREVAEELRLGYKTAGNYRTQIKHKLGVNTSAEMTRLAYAHGILKS
ncbi:MAG: response regulator transcription factor [Pseudomonadota bacterium]